MSEALEARTRGCYNTAAWPHKGLRRNDKVSWQNPERGDSASNERLCFKQEITNLGMSSTQDEGKIYHFIVRWVNSRIIDI